MLFIKKVQQLNSDCSSSQS